MSAFIVENMTINRIVSFFSMPTNPFIQYKIKKILSLDMTKQKDCKKLAALMFRMNIQAVNQRYSGRAEDFRTMKFNYQFTLDSKPIKTLKSLNCWIYQCSEDVIDTSKEYKLFVSIANIISNEIISDLPEYDKANCWK